MRSYALVILLLLLCFSVFGCGSKTASIVVEIPEGPIIPEEENLEQEVYFCPEDNCSIKMVGFIESAEEYVYCGLFDLDLENVIDALIDADEKGVKVKIVVDNENKLEDDYEFIRYDDSSQLSHNKFCVIDEEIVWTGSFNPTFNGDTKNNNNVIVFYSKYLAENYESEFWELWYGDFGEGARVEYDEIVLNGHRLNNYFCPEDDCEEHVLEILDSAEDSVYFMTFSFTSDPIGQKLIDLAGRGVEVIGVFEASGRGQYTEYDKLKDIGLNVTLDKNKAKMHHKVFIVDEKVVVTGSYNPTSSGTSKNDENVIIIYDEEIANLYLEEFAEVYSGE
ncbi:hypothetical protein KY330_03155 [Candidatus Woesearchaeota archaeon]|nr:hypothetical protein [Candidatus Woesearchaeota archaeon]